MLGADTRVHDELDDELRTQCASLGLDPVRLVSPAAGSEEIRIFELWPEHQEAFEVFHACRTQWRVVAGAAGTWHQGLDFGAVDVAMRRLGIPRARQREVFLQLQVMEDEGIGVLNA